MRYKYQGVTKNGNGKVLQSATIAVYEAGGTTAADVYTANSGGTAVNSVTSDTSGFFYFWVDSGDYAGAQGFKLVISKANFASSTYDYIYITRPSGFDLVDDTTPVLGGNLGDGGHTIAGRDVSTDGTALDTAVAKLALIEAAADVTGAANVAAAGAVMNTGAETVAGVKTFSSSPVVPTPTTDMQSSTKKYVDDNNLFNAYLRYADVKSSGTDGGTPSAAARNTRTLLADTDTASIGSIASNQITLPEGDYVVKASAPARSCNGHKLYLYDITNTADLLIGTSSYTSTAISNQSVSLLSGLISLTGTTVIELQHYITSNAGGGEGLGTALGDGNNEVYSVIEFWRLI